ncbi:MAG: heme-binding protein [Rhodospirillaceae bacterium]
MRVIKVILFSVIGMCVLGVAAMAVYRITHTVETPDYVVQRSEGDFEVRDYPALVVAQITKPGDRGTAVQFSGSWTDERFSHHAARLEGWLAANNLTAIGTPEFGYYNDPFTPGFMRRNEVLVEIARE